MRIPSRLTSIPYREPVTRLPCPDPPLPASPRLFRSDPSGCGPAQGNIAPGDAGESCAGHRMRASCAARLHAFLVFTASRSGAPLESRLLLEQEADDPVASASGAAGCHRTCSPGGRRGDFLRQQRNPGFSRSDPWFGWASAARVAVDRRRSGPADACAGARRDTHATPRTPWELA